MSRGWLICSWLFGEVAIHRVVSEHGVAEANESDDPND